MAALQRIIQGGNGIRGTVLLPCLIALALLIAQVIAAHHGAEHTDDLHTHNGQLCAIAVYCDRAAGPEAPDLAPPPGRATVRLSPPSNRAWIALAVHGAQARAPPAIV